MQVELHGEGFMPLGSQGWSINSTCCLGSSGLSGSLKYISSTLLSCELYSRSTNSSESLDGGIFEIGMALDGVNYLSTTARIRLIPTPFVANVQPTGSSIDGGETVRVEGSGFDQSLEMLCIFGNQSVVATIISDVLITCLSPKRNIAGVSKFGLGKLFGREVLLFSGLETFPFVHYSPLTGLSATPLSGPTFGTLINLNYQGSLISLDNQQCVWTSVLWGRFAVSLIAEGKESALCIMPSLRPGMYCLSISLNGHDDYVVTSSFIVADQPVLQYLSAPSGTIAGGTLVEIFSSTFVSDIPLDNIFLCIWWNIYRGCRAECFVGSSKFGLNKLHDATSE